MEQEVERGLGKPCGDTGLGLQPHEEETVEGVQVRCLSFWGQALSEK